LNGKLKRRGVEGGPYLLPGDSESGRKGIATMGGCLARPSGEKQPQYCVSKAKALKREEGGKEVPPAWGKEGKEGDPRKCNRVGKWKKGRRKSLLGLS